MVCETLEYGLLDYFIIKENEKRNKEGQRPQLELPIDDDKTVPGPSPGSKEKPERGVYRIDIDRYWEAD